MTEAFNIEMTVLPIQAILLVGVIVGFIYLTIKLVKRYLFVLVKSETWVHRIQYSWPRIELIIWLMVLFFVLVYLLNQSFLVTIVLVAIVFVLGGKSWRDVITGVTMKFENRITQGDYLTSENHKGVVDSLGIRGIVVRIDNGENAFIPYRNLTGFKVRKLERDLKSEMSSIIVKFKPEIPMDTAMRKLKMEVLQIPYVLLTQPVQVEVVEVSEEANTLRAVIFTQSHDSGKLAEKALNSALVELKLVV